MKKIIWGCLVALALFSCTVNGNTVKAKLINLDGIGIIKNNAHLTLSIKDEKTRKTTQDMLLDIVQLAVNNIANANTTRTQSGDCYYPLFASITPDLKYQAQEEKKTKWVHDPTHPDAKVDGEKKGWVEYPDIDIVATQGDIDKLIQVAKELNE